MMKRLICFVLILLAVSIPACGVVQEKEKERAEITAALQKYLTERSGLNLSAMDWKIEELNTDRDTADLKVVFTSKQGGATMVMEYKLQRENGVWSVQKPAAPGGQPAHPGAEAPPTVPPGAGTGAMPPGHPPLTSPAPAKAQPAPKKSN